MAILPKQCQLEMRKKGANKNSARNNLGMRRWICWWKNRVKYTAQIIDLVYETEYLGGKLK